MFNRVLHRARVFHHVFRRVSDRRVFHRVFHRACVFHRALLRVFHRFVHRPLSLNPQLHASPTARLKSAIDQSPFGHRLPSKFFGSTFFLLRVRS